MGIGIGDVVRSATMIRFQVWIMIRRKKDNQCVEIYRRLMCDDYNNDYNDDNSNDDNNDNSE